MKILSTTFLYRSKFNKGVKRNQCNEFFKSITTFYFAAIYNSSLSTNFFTRKIIILFTAYNFRYFYNETKKGWKKRNESTVDLRVIKIQEIITQIKLGHAEYTRACFYRLQPLMRATTVKLKGLKMCF